MRRRARHLTVATALAVGALGLAVPATAAPNSGYVPIRDSAYQFAPTDTDLGPAGNDRVTFELSMSLRDPAAAKALAYAVSDPASPQYGRFLSDEQFRQRFAPTERQVEALENWLTGSGLRFTYEPENHLLLTVTGTARAAERTFRTEIHRIDDGFGDVYAAPVAPMQAPASIASVVNGVIRGVNGPAALARPMRDGTDEADRSARRNRAGRPARDGRADTDDAPVGTDTPVSTAPPDAAFVNAPPCSAYWGEKTASGLPALTPDYVTPVPYAPCGYTAPQLAGAYGSADLLRQGITGKGVTVAITDAYASPTIVQDITTYAARTGSPAWKPGQFRQITPKTVRLGYDDPAFGGDACGEQGWYGEETLDVEAVHAVAPDANVLYVGASSCLDADLLNALNDIVDPHRADIITNSWGSAGEATTPVLGVAYTNLFLQAAVQGIGVFYSSGDDGDEVDNFGDRQPDFPAVDPWVTAVGGTSIGIGARNDYLFETGWGTTRSILAGGAWSEGLPGVHLYGAGGGTSRTVPQPAYQRGVVPDALSGYFGPGRKGRVVPDIAALGDPQTGFLVGQTQTFPDGSVRYGEYRIGGTSLASPVMAGIQALADQAAGRPHGFANPALYRLAGSNAVRDVVKQPRTLSVLRVDYVNAVDATDGTRTSLRTLDQTQSLATRRGYDDVTGIGTPLVANYVRRLGR